MIYGILAFLCIAVALVLILLVVIQNSKGGGLNSAFGGQGATQILGARRTNEFIEKLTWYFATGLAVLAFVTNVVGSAATSGDEGSNELKIEKTLTGTTAAPTTAPNPAALKGDEKAAPKEAPKGEEQPAPAPDAK